MYVTDTPVVERLTDRRAHELDVALDAMETALADLDGWIEEHEAQATGVEPQRYGHPATPEEIRAGLAQGLNAACAAHDRLAAVLGQPI